MVFLAFDYVYVALGQAPVSHGSAIDMVQLVKEHAGTEVKEVSFNFITFLVEIGHFDTHWSFDHAPDSREGSAILPIELSILSTILSMNKIVPPFQPRSLDSCIFHSL